ncbi:hypothetical protein M3Y94_01277600 [Aphelenchoides besseyi]|nr:hypothetical protein M3Y94_01277600 [Aphelenchoides besseyi]
MTTTTSTMHVPLLHDQDSDHEDVERGVPPSYEQVQNDGARFMGPKMRSDGKDPVALADASIRLGNLIYSFLRKVLGILSFQFAATVILCAALYLTPVVRGFVQQQ